MSHDGGLRCDLQLRHFEFACEPPAPSPGAATVDGRGRRSAEGAVGQADDVGVWWQWPLARLHAAAAAAAEEAPQRAGGRREAQRAEERRRRGPACRRCSPLPAVF